MAYVNFISDEEFLIAVKAAIETMKKKQENVESPTVDPFGVLLETTTYGTERVAVLDRVTAFHIQTQMHHAMSDFHTNVLAAIAGWEKVFIDGRNYVVSSDKKIIAEVKNSFVDVQGIHRVAMYDVLAKVLDMPEYAGYTGQFVEVISMMHMQYDDPFEPVIDASVNKRRAPREDLRMIDGTLFYALATGEEKAFENMIKAFPEVLKDAAL